MAALDLGADIVCRREVYDALTAAGGALPYDDLRDAVAPRLRNFALREIGIAGGLDAYLRERLAGFTRAARPFARMLTIDNDHVALRGGFVMKVTWPDGKVRPYPTGLARRLDMLAHLGQLIADDRRGGRWDGLVPAPSERAVAELGASMHVLGWSPSATIVVDTTDYVIDGRARLAIATAHGLRPLVHTDAWLTPAISLHAAYHLNASRLPDKSLVKYRDDVAHRYRISWDDYVNAVAATHSWRHSSVPLSRHDLVDVDVPGHGIVRMSRDRRYVHLRDFVAAAGAPGHYGQTFAKHLEQVGLPVTRARATGSQHPFLAEFTDLAAYDAHGLAAPAVAGVDDVNAGLSAALAALAAVIVDTADDTAA